MIGTHARQACEVTKRWRNLNFLSSRTNTEFQEAEPPKSQFLANMTHEPRTTLDSILGYTDMIHCREYGK